MIVEQFDLDEYHFTASTETAVTGYECISLQFNGEEPANFYPPQLRQSLDLPFSFYSQALKHPFNTKQTLTYATHLLQQGVLAQFVDTNNRTLEAAWREQLGLTSLNETVFEIAGRPYRFLPLDPFEGVYTVMSTEPLESLLPFETFLAAMSQLTETRYKMACFAFDLNPSNLKRYWHLPIEVLWYNVLQFEYGLEAGYLRGNWLTHENLFTEEEHLFFAQLFLGIPMLLMKSNRADPFFFDLNL